MRTQFTGIEDQCFKPAGITANPALQDIPMYCREGMDQCMLRLILYRVEPFKLDLLFGDVAGAVV